MSPVLILGVGVVVVIGLIIVLRVNAFIALISAAIIVSLLAPGELADRRSHCRVRRRPSTTTARWVRHHA